MCDASFPGRPTLDTAVSRALLRRVGEGKAPETLRLYRPDDVLAFSVRDRTRPGFGRALEEARACGFAPILRLVGGSAAVFHRETLAFAWSVPDPEPRRRIEARFRETAELVAAALRRLGVDARIGEVPGEYCPGAWSVNARGRTKLMGVGQRVTSGAAHVGGVIVVADGARVGDVLHPVYRALGLDFDPATVGSVAKEVGATSPELVADALLDEFRLRYDVALGRIEAGTLALAERLAPQHEAAPPLAPTRETG